MGLRFSVIFGVFGIWSYPHEGQLSTSRRPLGRSRRPWVAMGDRGCARVERIRAVCLVGRWTCGTDVAYLLAFVFDSGLVFHESETVRRDEILT